MIFNSVLAGGSGGGGGSSLETCTVTISEQTGTAFTLYYLDAEGVYQQKGPQLGGTMEIQVPINSIICLKYGMTPYFFDDSDTFVHMSADIAGTKAFFRFTGDGHVSLAC